MRTVSIDDPDVLDWLNSSYNGSTQDDISSAYNDPLALLVAIEEQSEADELEIDLDEILN